MKSARQLKDLIRNAAKQRDVDSQLLLRNYMLERLLERISLSALTDKFILKGGMLVAALVGIDRRTTMDMDATLKNFPLSEKTLQQAFEEIVNVRINDGVHMVVTKIEPIRESNEYNGYRLSILSKLETMTIPIKIDITTGDEIIPKEVTYGFDLLLEDRTIKILAYTIESVLAEKLETLISRGLTNTRMRDFYDIHILLKIQHDSINWGVLASAVLATAKRRGSHHLLSDGKQTLLEVFQNRESEQTWKRYQMNFSYADEISWNDIEDSTLIFWRMIEEKLSAEL